MAWRIYKEGQGKWLRGSMAGLLFLASVVGVMNLHQFIGRLTRLTKFRLPGINWQFDWRLLVDAPILLFLLSYTIVLYNKPKVVDFLIETENELKNRVTWPSRKEEVNASIVVVVTVLIMMFYIYGIDAGMSALSLFVYKAR